MLNGVSMTLNTTCTSDPNVPCAPIGRVASNGVLQTAGIHMRSSAAFAPQLGFGAPGAFTQMRIALANGDYQAVANQLNVLGFPSGDWLRRSGQFPENFIKTNPQFQNAIFDTNAGYSNYHSMQAQVTLRPSKGVDLQATYTWSRNLGVAATTYTDPTNRALDYTLLPSHRSHVFASYGSWSLPFGAGRRFAPNAGRTISRIIGDWQTSWIVNLMSGQPLNVSAQSMLYGNGVPDIVGPFDPKSAGVAWPEGAPAGNYFGDRYVEVPDPQCATIAATLQALCSLRALQDTTTGQIVLQNPQPGRRGTLGLNKLYSPGRWNVDMALTKGIRLTESKQMQIRVDATNVFNHPTPSGSTIGAGTGERIVFPLAPDVNLTNTTPFGYLGGKIGGRTFQGTVRLDF
jgi:hypothetical protein